MHRHPGTPWHRAAVLLALTAVGAAQAQAPTAYRCPGPGGVTSFQQAPCSGGAPLLIRTLNVVDAWRPPAYARAGRDHSALALDLTPSVQRPGSTRQALQRLPEAAEEAAPRLGRW